MTRTEMIGQELMKSVTKQNAGAENKSMFTIKTANQTIQDAALRPNPEPLWLSLWYEGEVCCLFADSNLGKSIYAVQIGADIASKGKKVLYFDFELSDKQFQLRYSDDNGNLHEFSDNLYRIEINSEATCVGNFEEAIISNIEQTVTNTGAKVVIIDNLTYLCVASEKGDLAGTLMMNLLSLKRKYSLSMLVIAHTPKRPLSSPITQNDLAGSKKLYNLFNSAFAIGQSAKDSNLRYIKQLKVRNGNYTYDADNVIVSTIEKIDTMLQFVPMGYATEREHLKERTEKDDSALAESVKQKIAEGMTYRATANELGISLSKVQRILKSK